MTKTIKTKSPRVIEGARVVTQAEIAEMASGLVFLDVAMRGTSLRLKTNATEVGADADQAEMLHMHKDLIDQKELREVRSYRLRLKLWLATQGVKAPSLTRPGIVAVPIGRVKEVEQMIADTQASMMRTFDDEFVPRYPEIQERAKARLKNLFNESDYPTIGALRAAFRIDYRWLVFQTPDALSAVSKELYERESERLRVQWQEAWPSIRDGLREGFTVLVERMADALQPDPETGEYRKLKEPLVEKVHEFLRTFADRDLTGDDELNKLVAQAQKLLEDSTAKKLRGNQSTRDRIANGFNAIAANVQKLKTSGKRRIVFSDDV